jgi:IclR family transcriptional regulator, KDG regulon repressor
MQNEKRNRSGVQNGQEDLQTLARGLLILEAFSEKAEYGISDLARRLGLPKSAVHRVMSTLAHGRYVEQTAARRYRLGLKVLELGSLCRLRLDLATRAQPILEDLSNRAGANAHLAKLDGLEVFDLLRVEHPAPLRITRNPMLRRPAHCTALGKAILAFDNPSRAEEMVKVGLFRLTRKTIVQPERFHNELARVRKRGYAVDNEEFYPGTRCVAAPVFDDSERVVAAMSVSCLITQLTEDRVPDFALLVLEAALHLSRELGYGLGGGPAGWKPPAPPGWQLPA